MILIFINKPQQCLSNLSIIKLLLFLLLSSLCSSGKKGTIHNLHLGVGCYAPSLWEQSIYINNLELLCMGDLSVLPNLFISVWPHGYLSYNFNCDPMLLNFICSNCSSCDHCDLFQLTPMSLWHTPSLWGFFLKALFFLQAHVEYLMSLSWNQPFLGEWY